MLKKVLLSAVFVLNCFLYTKAQNIDWISWAEDDSVTLGLTNSGTDDSGNFFIPFYTSLNRDFKLFGKTVPIGSKPAGNKTGILKVDNKGNSIWNLIISTGLTGNAGSYTFTIFSVFEKGGSYYALGQGKGDLQFYKDNQLVHTLNISGYTFPFLVIKINPQGTIQWIRKIYHSQSTKYPSNINVNYKVRTFTDNALSNSISVILTHHDSILIDKDAVNTLSDYISGNRCNSTSFPKFKDYIPFYNPAGTLDTVITGMPDLTFLPTGGDKTNVYYAVPTCDSFQLSGVTLNKADLNILLIDSSYNLSFLMKTKRANEVGTGFGRYRSYAYSFNNLIPFSNTQRDTTLYSYVDSTLYSIEGGEFIIFDENHKFLRRKKVLNYSKADSIELYIRYYCFDSTIVYLYGEGQNHSGSPKNILINGISYTIPQKTFNFIMKMDEYMNILWLRLGADTTGLPYLSIPVIGDMLVDYKGNLLFTGVNPATTTSMFFGDTIPSQSFKYSFIVKLRDESITRGYVYPGPYCAGDSIFIPYTTEGVFSTANEFIAQMSDEYGNFEDTSKIIELGRLQSRGNDTIRGKLPLYQLNTSAAYRIRIISTSPPIQSYYKRDTLRLLIYSKDTADAGPDLFICKGGRIQLDTRGGSQWKWSGGPFVNAGDSAKRMPFVNPINTTEYRIIISDSSGCGVTDTDYVVVNVRPYITVDFDADTFVCKGFTQTIKAMPKGGDSTKYWYKWREALSFFYLSSADTLTVNPTKTSRYVVTVGDSCSNKITVDTITIHVDTVLTAFTSPDTAVCRGNPATVYAYGSGCNPQYYKYEWREKGKPALLGTGPSLSATPIVTTEYEVLLQDTTTLLSGTATVKVTVDNVFYINLTKDSTICKGQSIDLEAGVITCDSSQIDYTWDNGLGTGALKTVSPATTTTYTVIAHNKFNGLKDTGTITVTVRSPLSLSLNTDTTICVGETASLRAITSGGDSTRHTVIWKETSGLWTATAKDTFATPAKTTTYKAVLTDNCTEPDDSAVITITVRPPLKVTINPDTAICVGETAELRATPSGGNSSNHIISWKEVGGSWTSTSKNNSVVPALTAVYRAVLTDNCTTPADSAEITVTVRPPLKITVNPDTTICVNETAELRATVSGGDVANHTINWREIGGAWVSTSKNNTVNPASTTVYRVVLADNCTRPSDSTEITVTVRPPLQLAHTVKDSICTNNLLLLNASISGGNAATRNIEWSSDKGFLTTQNPAVDTPQTTTTYFIKLTDNCSPDVYDTVTVVVLPTPKADFDFNPASGCPPLKVTLNDLSTGNDTLFNSWTVETTETKGVKQYTHEFVKPGVYNLGLTVANSLGCTGYSYKTRVINVFTKPNANFAIKPEIRETESPLYLYNLSSGANEYTWDFGDGNLLYQSNANDTVYMYKDTGYMTVSLIAKNGQGCLDTLTQQIRVVDKINCVIPNAFTPDNQDNLNQIFQPVCAGVTEYTLTIFNRWGQTVLHCENCAWDGTYLDAPVPPGPYLYLLEIKGESKKKTTTSGTVNVIR